MILRQIEYFQTVCKHNNMTKAAKELHVAQPSVSNAIKALEQEIETNLFERKNNKIYLTNEGKYFLDKSTKIMDELNELIVFMKDLSNKKNCVKIGIPPMICSFLFPIIFSKFKSKHPNIKLEIFEFASPKINNLLNEGLIDVGIFVEQSCETGTLKTETIIKSEYCFCVNKNSRFYHMTNINVEQIADEPLIMYYADGSYILKAINKQFGDKNMVPNIVLNTEHMSTVKQLVRNNIASTFIMKNAVFPEDSLCTISLSEPITADICLAWKKDIYMYNDVSKFIKFMIKDL